jgi:hypothetical protein
MPEDQTGAVPDLEAVNGAPALCGELARSRNRLLVREAGGQHCNPGNTIGAQEITSHDCSRSSQREFAVP